MMEYNAAFFRLYENVFIVLKEELGEDAALAVLRRIMELGLKEAYDAAGFRQGSAEDFMKVIRGRDESVGLRVEFPEASESRIVYRFHTDPFPNLRGRVDHAKLDDTYMSFKVRYLLGSGWSYETTKHIWDGDEYTEHVIMKGAGKELKRYNKLVRDKVPEVIKSRGGEPLTRAASDGEYGNLLGEKLKEEVQEFMRSGDAAELADVLEVVFALAELEGISRDRLEEMRKRKAEERGSFSGRVVLEGVKE